MTAKTAGREMDAMIAQKVMGWKRGKDWGNGNGEWIIDGEFYKSHYMCFENTPTFSTTIIAAWMVVEKMRQDGFDFCIEGFTGGEWYVTTHQVGGPSPDYMEHADAAPLAICLAALKAVQIGETK